MVTKVGLEKKHTVRASLQVVELTKASTALTLEIRANQQKIGTLVIGRGSIEWTGGNRKNSKRLSWTRFAEEMNQLAYEEKTITVKSKAKKKVDAQKKPARKSNSSLMQPLQPSGALAAIVGSKALSRTKVVEKLWAYIRKHGLQDSENKRMINADDKLKVVFDGKKQVSMFDMTKLVNKHLS